MSASLIFSLDRLIKLESDLTGLVDCNAPGAQTLSGHLSAWLGSKCPKHGQCSSNYVMVSL